MKVRKLGKRNKDRQSDRTFADNGQKNTMLKVQRPKGKKKSSQLNHMLGRSQ